MDNDYLIPDDEPDLSRWSVPLDEEPSPPTPPPVPISTDDEPPVECRFPTDAEPYPGEEYQPRLNRFGER